MPQEKNEMKLKTVLIIIVLLGLSLLYFRFIDFSGTDSFIANYRGIDPSWHYNSSDLYYHYANVYQKINWAGETLGDYYVPRGGGYSAAANDWLFQLGENLMMITYQVFGNFNIAQKTAYFILCLLTITFAYWYCFTITKRKDASMIFAVAYSFCIYQINWSEYVHLYSSFTLIPLTLVFCERMFSKKKYIDAFFLGLFLTVMFLSSVYFFMFIMMYLVLRFITSLFWNETGGKSTAFKLFGTSLVVSFVLICPFFLPSFVHTSELPLSVIPLRNLNDMNMHCFPATGFFTRSPDGMLPIPPLPHYQFMYMGFSVVLLGLSPFILSFFSKTKPFTFENYHYFNLFMVGVFIIYSIGPYSPVNMAAFFHGSVPFFNMMYDVKRASIFVYFCIAMSASIGYIFIVDRLKTAFKSNKIVPIVVLLVVITAVFFDITWGFEPKTMTTPFKNNESYEYLKMQDDGSRIIEIPCAHDQQHLTYLYTGHDSLGWWPSSFGFSSPLWIFANQYYDLLGQKAPVADRLSFYGVEYVLLHLNPRLYEEYPPQNDVWWPDYNQVNNLDSYLKESKDFDLVYSDSENHIYKNLRYNGTIFAVLSQDYNIDMPFSYTLADAKISSQQPSLDKMTIQIETREPALLLISQSVNNGWKAEVKSYSGENTLQTDQYPISNVASIQGIELAKSGKYEITLLYAYHGSSLRLFPVFYMPVLLVIIIFLLKYALKEKMSWPVNKTIGIILAVYSGIALAAVLGINLSLYHSLQIQDNYDTAIIAFLLMVMICSILYLIYQNKRQQINNFFKDNWLVTGINYLMSFLIKQGKRIGAHLTYTDDDVSGKIVRVIEAVLSLAAGVTIALGIVTQYFYKEYLQPAGEWAFILFIALILFHLVFRIVLKKRKIPDNLEHIRK